MVDEASRPTREQPLQCQGHMVYFVGPEIQVVKLDGDVTPEVIDTLVSQSRPYSRECMVLIRDVRRLGKVGAAVRRQMSKLGYRGMGVESEAIRVVVVGASVVQRALVMMVRTAMKLSTGDRMQVVTKDSMEEAFAYAREFIASRRRDT